jgi:hypothetical protein
MNRYFILSVLVINGLLSGTAASAQTATSKESTEKKTASGDKTVKSSSFMQTNNGKTTIIQTDDNGLTYRLLLEGELTLADDERSITGLSNGGRFEYSRKAKGESEHKVVVRNNGTAQLQQYYYINDAAQDASAGGVWLAQYLPEMVTKTGIGAEARAEKLFKEGGVSKVLAFTATMNSGIGRDRMYRYLLEKESLSANDIQAVLEQVAQGRTSDYELARMLTHIPGSMLTQPGVANAYVKAAVVMSSDYEKARTLKHLLAQGQMPASALNEVAKGVRNMSSDYEKVGVLTTLASRSSLSDDQFLFAVTAVENVSSDYERGKGLSSLLQHEQLVLKHFDTFIPVIKTMGSDYEKAKVYTRLLAVKNLTADTYVALLNDSEKIGSDYEKSKLLQQIAKQMPKEDKKVREAYLKTAKTIGSSYEYERAAAVYQQ